MISTNEETYLGDKPSDGRVTVNSTIVNAVMLDDSFLDPRRDQDRWNAERNAISMYKKVIYLGAFRLRRTGPQGGWNQRCNSSHQQQFRCKWDCQDLGRQREGGHGQQTPVADWSIGKFDMQNFKGITYAMLVEGEDEKGVIPLRRSTNSLIDWFRPPFTQVDWAGRMHGIVTAALIKKTLILGYSRKLKLRVFIKLAHLRVYISELRKISICRIGEELGNRLDIGGDLVLCLGPGVELGIWIEAWVIVIDPSNVILRKLLENRTLRQAENIERVIILSMSMGSSGCYVCSIILSENENMGIKYHVNGEFTY